MLRRKLLTYLIAMVVLLLAASTGAIWMLQDVLDELDHVNVDEAAYVDTANRMGVAITEIEVELREIQLGRERHLDNLFEHVESLQRDTKALDTIYTKPMFEAHAVYPRITTNLQVFSKHVGTLATTEDEASVKANMAEAMTASVRLRRDIMLIGQLMRDHTRAETRHAVSKFRWLVLGLAIVFLLVINVFVILMLRVSQMVLKPVGQLVEATRRLGEEEYAVRVQVEQHDEFGELARAYNHLAEQLQLNEQRRVETLGQAAVMLNHELNNASAIIKLQLKLLERQSNGSDAMSRSLRQIDENLARMTATVDALKRVRRIVLTDYTADTKMLDLQKSTAE